MSVPEGWPTRRAEHRAMLDAAAARDADLTVERMAIHYLIDDQSRRADQLAEEDAGWPAPS